MKKVLSPTEILFSQQIWKHISLKVIHPDLPSAFISKSGNIFCRAWNNFRIDATGDCRYIINNRSEGSYPLDYMMKAYTPIFYIEKLTKSQKDLYFYLIIYGERELLYRGWNVGMNLLAKREDLFTTDQNELEQIKMYYKYFKK